MANLGITVKCSARHSLMTSWKGQHLKFESAVIETYAESVIVFEVFYLGHFTQFLESTVVKLVDVANVRIQQG